MGRSIGSGPAVHLSQQYIKPNAPLPSQYQEPPPSSGLWDSITSMFDTAACVSDHTESPRTVSTPTTSTVNNPPQKNQPRIPNSQYMIENLLAKAGVKFDSRWPKER